MSVASDLSPGGRRRLTTFAKALRFNWAIAVLILAVATIGFLMLFSVAGGDVFEHQSKHQSRFADAGFAENIAVLKAMSGIKVHGNEFVYDVAPKTKPITPCGGRVV